ncbi:MAG: hypothetical protein AABX30_02540 [Nanoarchaeota archaeon]
MNEYDSIIEACLFYSLRFRREKPDNFCYCKFNKCWARLEEIKKRGWN